MKNSTMLLSMVLASVSLFGCGPVEDVQESPVDQIQSSLVSGRWKYLGDQTNSLWTGFHYVAGVPMLTCRGSYAGALHVGKTWNKLCYVPYADYNVQLASYESLDQTNNVKWVSGNAWTAPPSNAIIGGYEAGANQLICRVVYIDGVHPGKWWGNQCFIAWADQAIPFDIYELLVSK